MNMLIGCFLLWDERSLSVGGFLAASRTLLFHSPSDRK
jgi:hypothetical protein